jgi:beta-glucosidase
MTNKASRFVPTLRKPSYRNIWVFFLILISSVLVGGSQESNAQTPSAPYKNPGLDVDSRVEDLIGRMTPEEKVRQLDMYFGCEDLLDTNQCASKTHAKPDAVFNPQAAAKNLGTFGVG